MIVLFFSNPINKEHIKRTINTQNHILVIPVDAPEIPVNPTAPAIKAISINVMVQRHIRTYYNSQLHNLSDLINLL
ncbi:hypothetical protein [Algibacter mikhailovii]|uniref:hypothetical protein n=1 Tax=Algibacter mikhailovii TaxID=425498 RepID=UPI003F70BA3C